MIELDPAAVRALERHELLAQAGTRRTLRDLEDALLLADPIDADPFVNRAGALRFPSGARAFDGRLDELVVLFATIGRIPHVRTSPLHGVPADLPQRLRSNGFALAGESVMMARSDPDLVPRQGTMPDGVRIRRLAGLSADSARAAAADAATVLAAAFDVATVDALSGDLAAALGDPRTTLYLVEADGEPVCVAKRFTADGLSFLSSVGTVPAWRGRGLASAASAAAMADAVSAGSRLIHLTVEPANRAARRVYAALGFIPVGAPTGHYLAG